MRALLDTHVLLWWVTRSERLSVEARRLFEGERHELLWSSASTWELGIKAQLGKIRFSEALGEFVPRLIEDEGLIGLPIYHDHALQAAGLPPLHRDPFDRMLVAQALVERIPLVTRDRQLEGYGVECIQA